MNVYMYVEAIEIEEVDTTAIAESIAKWIADTESKAVLVQPNEDSEEELEESDRELTLGMTISITKGRQLKEPLNFLNKLAKDHKVDFVVGMVDDESGEEEDVCYFGHEEGRPDMFEISTYLGIKS